jgi:hypothetical protein
MKLIQLLKVLLLTSLLLTGRVWATAQQPDVLIVDGKDESLYTNPLSDWLELHPDAMPKTDVMSSGNWRGYVATWEVANDKLWLRRVEVAFVAPDFASGVTKDKKGENALPRITRREVRAQLFPDKGDVIADWYTGTLIIPKGELVNYVHMGYGSTYERYAVIWVRRGEVTRRLDLRAEQFMELRKERFKAYRKTDEYKKQLADTAKTLGAERAEDFLFEFDSERYLSLDPEIAP